MRKPWKHDRYVLALIRPMTPEEVEDLKAGYPASSYQRRLAARCETPEREQDGHDAETSVGEAA